MSKIYQYFGLIFEFHSNDHYPIHVHVIYNEFGNKLVFVYKNGKLIGFQIKRIKGRKYLPPSILREAKQVAVEYEKQIRRKWNEFYVLKQKPRFEVITKRIR
jgi:hypothetical protein